MGTITYNWYDTPSTNNGQKRYHARVSNAISIDFEAVCKDLEYNTMATKADVKGVVESLSQLLIKQLSSGAKVHLKGIGHFSVSLDAPSFDDPAEINGSQIKVHSINFLPDKAVVSEINRQASFKKSIASERSAMPSDEEMKQLLADYFETHQYITGKEFRLLFNQTRSTAYRRLSKLCKETQPVLIRIGGARSSLFILNRNIL
jgi:predicted histone-like DNA-binding protein